MTPERDTVATADPRERMAAPQQVHRPPDEEYERRWANVRKAVADRGFDALLVVSPENVYYLTGLQHQGYFAFTSLVIPAQRDPLLVTRSMERRAVVEHGYNVEHLGFEDHETPVDGMVRALEAAGLSRSPRVGVEKQSMFFPPAVWDELRAGLPDVGWEDGSGIVDEIRAVKSAWELQRVRRAAAISDRAVRAGIEAAGVGVNEKEVAAAVYRSLVLGGSEYPGFAPLVRSTDHLGHEHETWHDRVLAAGDGVLIELSASVDRYHAPLTRLVHVGWGSPGLDTAAETAIAGLEASAAAIQPGVRTGDVYEAWQSTIDRGLGHERYRRHHCGYSVGIGFPPSWVGGSSVVGIRQGGELVVQEGMVFHLLSWLLGVGSADYAVSDTVVVTATGCEFLTSTRREPLIIA